MGKSRHKKTKMRVGVVCVVGLALIGLVSASHPATPTVHKPFFDNGAGALEEQGGKGGDDTLKSVLPLMLMMSMRRNAYAGMGAGIMGHPGMMWPYAQSHGMVPPPVYPYMNSYGGYGTPGFGAPGMGAMGMGGMGGPGMMGYGGQYGYGMGMGAGAGNGMFYPSHYGDALHKDHEPMFTQLAAGSTPGFPKSSGGIF